MSKSDPTNEEHASQLANTQLKSLQNELLKLQSHLTTNEIHKAYLAQVLKNEYGSKSWRITQPLRRIERLYNQFITMIKSYVKPQPQLDVVYYWVEQTIQHPKNTGIQRVCRQLAKGLMTNGIKLIPVKWDYQAGEFSSVNRQELEHFSKWGGPAISMWQSWVTPTPQQKNAWFIMPELIQQMSQIIKFVHKVGLRSAIIFHDAIPWKMPNIYPKDFCFAHYEYMLMLSRFDLIFPISQFTYNDLLHFWEHEYPNHEKISSQVLIAILPGEFPDKPRITEVKLHQNSTCKIVCIGSIDPRKNHTVLLEAFKLAIKNSKIKLALILVGDTMNHSVKLSDSIQQTVQEYSEITWEKNLDDARLHILLQECDFTVFPSVEEGFGLPILESLWHGKPCICANFGAMAELTQDGGCLTVDVTDTRALADAICQLAENTSLRSTLIKEATQRSFKTWNNYAEEIIQRIKLTSKSAV